MAKKSSRRDFLRGQLPLSSQEGSGDELGARPSSRREAGPQSYLLHVSRPAMASRFELIFNAGQYENDAAAAVEARSIASKPSRGSSHTSVPKAKSAASMPSRRTNRSTSSQRCSNCSRCAGKSTIKRAGHTILPRPAFGKYGASHDAPVAFPAKTNSPKRFGKAAVASSNWIVRSKRSAFDARASDLIWEASARDMPSTAQAKC